MALHLLLQILWLIGISSSSSSSQAKNLSCPSQNCGDVIVPYPFGIGDPACYRDEGFTITCNDTFNPPKPFLGKSNIEVLNISLLGHVMINGDVDSKCRSRRAAALSNSSWPTSYSNSSQWMRLQDDGPYTFSDTENKFVAIGCDLEVFMRGSQRLYSTSRNFTTRCVSTCGKHAGGVRGSSCYGFGCCQTSIPKGLKEFTVNIQSYGGNGSDLLNSSFLCSSTFLMDKHQFDSNASDLSVFFVRRKYVPVVLDWAIGNQTCEEARQNMSTAFACRSLNSHCLDSSTGIGYRCFCDQGFQGNPYLINGCEDINECEDPSINPCTDICQNTLGNYCCSCPFGTRGDGRKNGIGCIPWFVRTYQQYSPTHVLKISLGIGLGLFLLLVTGSLYYGLRKRKLIKRKQKFFKQNGGLLLKQKISSHEAAAETTKIFTTEELSRATNNYDENRIIGRGGQGTVYKGVLSDETVVAIKKSKNMDENQIENFINEVVFLSQINHRNVVKLIGCCLETEVPLLVYEFIMNGTLFDHIHKEGNMSSISWENRLRIAAETAGALAYLHSAASIPIIHRDVKSANILLDDNYTAKVSDFGASRSVPFDQTHVTTLVQGTLGYLDPEYFHTSQLTEKSDVYSFGVVLLELLTGEMAVSYARTEDDRNLVSYFISNVNENRLLQIIEARVVDEGRIEHLQQVAELAMRCLMLKGKERPTMKEVASELEGLRRFQEHPLLHPDYVETEQLLSEPLEG